MPECNATPFNSVLESILDGTLAEKTAYRNRRMAEIKADTSLTALKRLQQMICIEDEWFWHLHLRRVRLKEAAARRGAAARTITPFHAAGNAA